MNQVRIWAVMAAISLMLLCLAGCAYTTVVSKEKVPEPGPPIAAGYSAVMPEVQDLRNWEAPAGMAEGDDLNLPNIQIFAPEITNTLRTSLLNVGLFKNLPEPETVQAGTLTSTLTLQMNDFSLAPMGHNAWVVPHLLVDGILLPATTVVAVLSKGDIDMGGYYIPSQYMGTNLSLTAYYKEKDIDKPLLERNYLIQVEVASVSESTLRQRLHENAYAGAEMAKVEGRHTIEVLAKTMAGDVNWAYLDDYRRVVLAEELFRKQAPLEQQIAAAIATFDLLRPLRYTEEEAIILRDGFLDGKARARVMNDLRAGWLADDNVENLPPEYVVNEEQAENLFNDPAVARGQVEAGLANRVMTLAFKILTPPEDRPLPTVTVVAAGPSQLGMPTSTAAPHDPARVAFAPTAPLAEPLDLADDEEEVKIPEPANAPELRQKLRASLAQKVAQDFRLQLIMLNVADLAVGPTWLTMEGILQEIPTPLVQGYLQKRNDL